MLDWYEIAATLTRPAFAAQHPHPFLLVLQDLQEDPQEFRTSSVRQGLADAAGESDVPGTVIALVKSGANPYGSRIIVGRARNCDVVLRDPSISKVHADFAVLGSDEAELTDRQSRNGTWVNGTAIAVARSVTVRNGDRIMFGSVAAAFLDPTALHEAIT